MPWIKGRTIGTRCFVLLLVLCSDMVLASPPLPDDFSLAMHIESATDPELGPGALAILVFDVRHFGPVGMTPFYVVNAPYLVPPEPLQPIRLSNVPDSDCSFSAYEYVTTNPPGMDLCGEPRRATHWDDTDMQSPVGGTGASSRRLPGNLFCTG